jgi:uncharacterized protein (TIRG00374 family)
MAVAIRWYRYQKNASGYEAAALITFERVVQLLVVAFMGAFFLSFDVDVLKEQGYVLMLFSSTLSLLVLIIFLLFLSRGFGYQVDAILKKIANLLPEFIEARLRKLWTSISAFRSVELKSAISIIMLTIVAYVLFVFSAWIILEGMNINISLHTLIWVRSVVFILTLIPISVGGIGVRDVTIIYFLGLFGINQEEAFAFSLALLAVQLLIGLWGGVIELFYFLERNVTIKH